MGTSENRDRIRSRLDAIARGGDFAPETGTDEVDNEPVDPDYDSPTPDWLTDPQSTDRRGARWAPERLRAARLDPGRRGVLALAVVGLFAAVFAGVSIVRDKPVAQAVPPLPVVHAKSAGAATSSTAPTATTGRATAVPPTEDVVVSVVGLVVNGGLVRLPPGARIADAVAAAGGVRDGADLLGLNMAQRVADGDQIVVGTTDGSPGPVSRSPAVDRSSDGPDRGSQPAGGGKVSLNSASEQELDALPGVGPVTAAAIVAWRTSNGQFTDVEQLGEVDGIGPGRLAKLRELVAV